MNSEEISKRVDSPVAQPVAAATARSKWTDWRPIHVEKEPFLNEMLGDRYRWKQEGVHSVMVQESPKEVHETTPLRILGFSFEDSSKDHLGVLERALR